MEINSNIIISKSELEELGTSIPEVTSNLSLLNPDYTNGLRFSKRKFGLPDKYICYLKISGDKYVLPRYYFGEPSDSSFGVKGRELTSEHSIVLRDYQKKFFEDNQNTIDNVTGLLLEAPCGHGKTIMGIWLSYIRGVQTMIIVPTYYLATQWKERIESVTNASCIIVRPTDSNIPTDTDFTIIVTDLFNCRVLPKELIDNVGHVILDEAHRMGAETYLPILDDVPAKYRTALTATFRRTDGVHKILKYHFGEHIKMDNRFPRPLVYGVKTNIDVQGCVSKKKPCEHFLEFMHSYYCDSMGKMSETPSAVVYDSRKTSILRDAADKAVKDNIISKTAHRQIVSCLSKGASMAYPTVESYLNENSSRRKLVIRLIKKCMDSGRTVLFLSKRKDTLRALYKYFKDYKPMLIVSETNSRSKEESDYLQNECRLIFGVNQLAKEGLDIDRLDTLIIHLPMADTEQAIGRISRLHKDKKQPMAFYLVDGCPLTYATFNKAKKTFALNADYKGDIGLQSILGLL